MPYKEPFSIFKLWFQEARESSDIVNPSIVCLATATRYVNDTVFLIYLVQRLLLFLELVPLVILFHVYITTRVLYIRDQLRL